MPVDQYFDCPISALGIFPETVRPELLDFARTEYLILLPQEPFQEQLGIGEFFRLPVWRLANRRLWPRNEVAGDEPHVTRCPATGSEQAAHHYWLHHQRDGEATAAEASALGRQSLPFKWASVPQPIK